MRIIRMPAIFAAVFALISCVQTGTEPIALNCPIEEIEVSGQSSHVQGIAWDADKGRMYMSFTTKFLVVESDGTVVGSIDRINGHLGAMTFDPVSRRVYASLECKDDAIGQGVARSLGVDIFEESSFYIAEIDVDSVKSPGTPEETALHRIPVAPACEDYADSVELDGRVLPHRYACSGIDGITIGPGFGRLRPDRSASGPKFGRLRPDRSASGPKFGRLRPDRSAPGPEVRGRRFLYVAYGIYGDISRTDNDHQIILQYPLRRLQRGDLKPRKVFIHTGNTEWGVQNMAYDSATDQLFLAVYKGSKTEFPNYDLFAVPMSQRLTRSRLQGVPYERAKVLHAQTGSAWHYPLGSCGLCSTGNGNWCIAVPGRDVDGTHNCRVVIRQFAGASTEDAPFAP